MCEQREAWVIGPGVRFHASELALRGFEAALRTSYRQQAISTRAKTDAQKQRPAYPLPRTTGAHDWSSISETRGQQRSTAVSCRPVRDKGR